MPSSRLSGTLPAASTASAAGRCFLQLATYKNRQCHQHRRGRKPGGELSLEERDKLVEQTQKYLDDHRCPTAQAKTTLKIEPSPKPA